MPSTPIRHGFDYGAAPGGTWPAIVGATDEEIGSGAATGATVDKSEMPRIRDTSLDRWYPAGYWTTMPTSLATGTHDDTGYIMAVPFPTNGGGKLAKVAIKVATAAVASTARVAIYESVSYGNLMPGNLLWQSETIDTTTTGIKAVIVNKSLRSQTTAWACSQISSASLHLNVISYSTFPPVYVFGLDNTGANAAWGLSASQSYGAFPSKFPSVVSLLTTDNPTAILLQFGE